MTGARLKFESQDSTREISQHLVVIPTFDLLHQLLLSSASDVHSSHSFVSTFDATNSAPLIMDGDGYVEPELDSFGLTLPLPYRVAFIIVLGMAHSSSIHVVMSAHKLSCLGMGCQSAFSGVGQYSESTPIPVSIQHLTFIRMSQL